MDRNAYRDDNVADQPRRRDQLTTRTSPEHHADQPRTPADQREPYPDEHEPYPEQPDTYWRRRAATLAAGLGVLGLLAWAFSGGGGKPAPMPHNSPAAGAARRPGLPQRASVRLRLRLGLGLGLAVRRRRRRRPGLASQGTSGLPSAASSPAGKSAKSTASARAAQAAANTEPGGRCSPNSVVLSLFSGSRSYPSGQNPQFGVNAVSTAPGTCTFDLSPDPAAPGRDVGGPRHLGFGRLRPRRRDPAQLSSPAASRSRSTSPGTARSPCPAASRWPPRPASAATRRRPGRPPSAAGHSASSWSADPQG